MASMRTERMEFVMTFLEGSKRSKQPLLDKWREVEENFLVEPYLRGSAKSGYQTSPYDLRKRSYGIRDSVVLKDPETHKASMTYTSKIVKAIYGDRRREFVQARPSGWEDATIKAPEVTKLLKYVFGLKGHYLTMVETVLDMVLRGTGIIESPWRFMERTIPVRTVRSQYGVETESLTREIVPIYDDVCLRPVSSDDFFPDPGGYRLHDMNGVAKRFRMSKRIARALAEQGIYDKEQVEQAIRSSASAPRDIDPDRVREGDYKYAEPVTEFGEMVGYEYWGDVPEKMELVTEDGRKTNEGWGVITILNGIDVRGDAWPLSDYCFPFHQFIINPMQGRFWGVAPAEVIRFDQSFADALKMLVAEAIIRSVHPPIAYDSDADFGASGEAKIRAWKADTLIPVRGGPNAIGTLRYDANYRDAFAVQAMLTASMQGGSGAPGAIQGEPGPDREAATVGAARFEAAMGQPELAALVLETECLPDLARGIIKRYQQFLQGTEDLKRRIGEAPESMWIGDIMADFDIEFCGSRQALSKQERLQAFDRLVSYVMAIPAAQLFMPNTEILQRLIGDVLEMPDVAAAVGDPKTMLMNMLLGQAQGGAQGGPAGNGVPQGPEPAGMLPAQAAGGPYGGV